MKNGIKNFQIVFFKLEITFCGCLVFSFSIESSKIDLCRTYWTHAGSAITNQSFFIRCRVIDFSVWHLINKKPDPSANKLKLFFFDFYLNLHQRLVMKKPADSTASTTSGHTDTKSGQTSTTSGQTSTTSGQMSTTSGQTGNTSGQTSTTSGRKVLRVTRQVIP